MKKICFLLIALTLVVILPACGGTSAPAASIPPVPADYDGKTNPFGMEAAAVGAVNFNSYCEACHGATGRGDGPASQALDPRPANLSEIAAQVGDDYLFWRISEGKAGTSMVGWAGVLNEEQIWQVVSFIRTLQ
jgi:mono/diheme cytochrome c family protein